MNLWDMARTRNGRAGAGGGKRKQRKGGGTVIHVAFGSGGGRLHGEAEADGPATASARLPLSPTGASRSRTSFTPREVAKLLGGSPDAPAVARPGQDRVAVRAAREAARVHVPGPHRAARDARTAQAPRPPSGRRARHRRAARHAAARHPAAAGAPHRGRRASRRRASPRRGSFEPLTGQMVLDFQVQSLRDDVVRVLRPETSPARARTAYDLYVQASALDEDPATYDQAEELYGQRHPPRSVARHRLHEPRQHPLPARRRGGRRGALPARDRRRPRGSPRRTTTSAT